MHDSNSTLIAHSATMTVGMCITRHSKLQRQWNQLSCRSSSMFQEVKECLKSLRTCVQMPCTDGHTYPSPTTHYENMTTSGIYRTSRNGMVSLKHFTWTLQGYSQTLLFEFQLIVEPQGASRLWHTRFEKSFATFLYSSVWDHTSEEGRKIKQEQQLQVLRVTSESYVDKSICSSQYAASKHFLEIF